MKKNEKYNFIILLGKYLHTYGIPSYQIQSYLSEVAKKLGVKGTFMDSPTWINYVFYDDDQQAQSYNYIDRIPPGNLNLGAYSRVVETTNQLIANKINISDVEDRLANIDRKAQKVNHLFLTVA